MQYDVELIQRIEAVIGKKMELYPVDEEEVALYRERAAEAGRAAMIELKEQRANGGGKKRRKEQGGGRDEMDRDDDVVEAGMPTKKTKRGRK